MLPTISVVIPAFDAERHLPRALDAALGQTRPPDEVIVVDDGSRDATRAVALGYGDRVRLVAHERNRGLPAARNTGIRASRGDWIALLDADDSWLPQKLERQEQALAAANGSVGVAFCLCCIRTPDGALWVDCATDSAPQLDPARFLRTLLTKNAVSGSGCSPLVRRSLLLSVGGYDETLRTCEDWDLWLRLAPHCSFHRVDEVLCEGFARGDGLSVQLPRLLADAERVMRRHLPAFVPDPGEAEVLRQQALTLIAEYTGGLVRGAA